MLWSDLVIYLKFIIWMSERLSKLVDYINNQNYEMAIATYTDST